MQAETNAQATPRYIFDFGKTAIPITIVTILM